MITISFGIPKTWIDLLYRLYYPFLLSSRQIKCGCIVQHTILDGKKPVGYICVSLSKHLEVALLPQYRGKGIIEKILLRTIPKKIPEVYSFKKINYTVNLINYPSLKLLKKLGGGVYNVDKKKAYGHFYYLINKEVPKKHQELLDKIIELSKDKFEKWNSTQFVKQYNEVKKDIEKFQKDYVNGRINVTLEDIFGVVYRYRLDERNSTRAFNFSSSKEDLCLHTTPTMVKSSQLIMLSLLETTKLFNKF